MSWDMTMTDDLDEMFAAARRSAPQPPEALMARVLADAAASVGAPAGHAAADPADGARVERAPTASLGQGGLPSAVDSSAAGASPAAPPGAASAPPSLDADALVAFAAAQAIYPPSAQADKPGNKDMPKGAPGPIAERISRQAYAQAIHQRIERNADPRTKRIKQRRAPHAGFQRLPTAQLDAQPDQRDASPGLQRQDFICKYHCPKRHQGRHDTPRNWIDHA